MRLKLQGCSNPGFNLTDLRKEEIRLFIKWIHEHANQGPMTFMEIQEKIESEVALLDASKVRMIAPFLKKVGYIQDYAAVPGASLDLHELVTEEGNLLLKYLDIRSKIKELEYDDINLETLDQLINILLMLAMINHGEDRIYLDCINFLNKYTTMNKIEFCFMTTLYDKYGKLDYPLYETKLEKAINKYRKGVFKDKIDIERHVNAYQYISKILIECGVALKYERGSIILNDKYGHIFGINKEGE